MCVCAVPLVVVILGRDGLLLGASFYLRYTTLPPPVSQSVLALLLYNTYYLLAYLEKVLEHTTIHSTNHS